MSVLISGPQVRQVGLGVRVAKSTGTLAATTVPLFTVAGGQVLVTAMYGIVTTTVTVANSYKLQHNPTAAAVATADLFAATDIGTTDSPAGSLLLFDGVRASTLVIGAGSKGLTGQGLVLQPGQIESVSAGTDGVINWVLTYIPLDDGATVVAA